MNKIIGYILAIVGIAGLAAANIPQVRAMVSIPADINDNMLMLISGAVAVVGIILAAMGGRGRASKQPAEVPIFHGKNVIGYRRMGK